MADTRQLAPLSNGVRRMGDGKPVEIKSRLVVVEQVVWQAPNEQPAPCESRFSRWLESSDQAYGPRTLSVGVEWQKLDTGWVSVAGMMVLANRSTDKAATVELGLWVPLPEHILEDRVPGNPSNSQVVPLCTIPCGESRREPNPHDLTHLRVRILGVTSGKYAITLIPR